MRSDSPYFAAIDLGSNSFHMIIARVNQGSVETIDKVKEMVQIARGAKKNTLSKDAQERAISCLKRFSERLQEIPSANIRAVGTKSLRSASNMHEFLVDAEAALGQRITIISGYEEARLVYSGLAHSVTNDNNRRLVIDIGGASTEFIVGIDEEPTLLESLNFGCVAATDRYTKIVDASSMRKVYLSVSSDIEEIRSVYIRAGWDIGFGTSGTMRAIAELVAPTDGGAVIQATSLKKLYDDVIDNPTETLKTVAKLRADVLPAGIAILMAIFDTLKLKKIQVADATLKDGLIYDTLGRSSTETDARISAVAKLQRQYHIDLSQAARVSETAIYFWRNLKTPEIPGVSRTKVLTWAAQLHEVGLGISHSDHHHHSFYILSHSNLAGFGRYEQMMLAYLVRVHRKKLSKTRFEGLTDNEKLALYPMVMCLRLAVILHRNRQDIQTHLPLKQVTPLKFELLLSPQWFDSNPLTKRSLNLEVEHLKNMGIDLHILEKA